MTFAVMMSEKARTLARIRAGRDEAEILRLLGQWVSGLEPVIVRRHDGVLLGITPQGHDKVLLSAWWIA